jgi:putative FmdB family regulatory protein
VRRTWRRIAPAGRVCHDARAVPTYDYQCRSCERVIEVIHSMTSDGPSVCEQCGGTLRRILYPTGIIFKGSGFYSTDSRASSSNTKPTGSTATPSSTDGAPAASTPSAPKPETSSSSSSD